MKLATNQPKTFLTADAAVNQPGSLWIERASLSFISIASSSLNMHQ
jgi:hypothetical protein